MNFKTCLTYNVAHPSLETKHFNYRLSTPSHAVGKIPTKSSCHTKVPSVRSAARSQTFDTKFLSNTPPKAGRDTLQFRSFWPVISSLVLLAHGDNSETYDDQVYGMLKVQLSWMNLFAYPSSLLSISFDAIYQFDYTQRRALITAFLHR